MNKKILIPIIAGLASLNMAIAQPSIVKSTETAATESAAIIDPADEEEVMLTKNFKEALEQLVEFDSGEAARTAVTAGAVNTAMRIHETRNYETLDKAYSKEGNSFSEYSPKTYFMNEIERMEKMENYKKAINLCEKLAEFYAKASSGVPERSKLYKMISRDFTEKKKGIIKEWAGKAARIRRPLK